MKVIPAALKHTDLLIGEGVVKSEKRLKDTSFFADSAGVDPDLVLYEVYARTDQAKEGELNWGLSLLHPVTVNGECCMTRGHWHENTDAAEYYWCVGGTGLLLLMDEQGHAWAEEMEPGSLHHIPGVLAHRLINTGDEDLKVACCWPTTAGHDYARVEAMPFPQRAYKTEEGEIEWK
ncbi:glucose-6-phosphate isomerase family protein [Faecalibaculum rodentium]|jgi:glucose-6-phosphate isomerase|uniref:glucose-6-phosphate isomerase n=1 Tax=Faecalibaculum rodentium TaxID=1702221 RepID=A0A1Q9YMH0_9FIRM|nr:glucose-6-phosphate isomerase family protein [Faecalibaculum rodentium]OLU46436.1 glucose-6-phosphate isomerase [Faecalibaculum rodentium]